MKIIYVSPWSSTGAGQVAKQILEYLEKEQARFVEAKFETVWGTYGKDAKEPLRYVRLIDCSTDHLQAILKTQPQLDFITSRGFTYRKIIQAILDDRKA